MTTFLARPMAFLKTHRYYAAGAFALLIIISAVIWSQSGSTGAEATVDAKPSVVVGRVADLMGGGDSLSVVAEIRSISEAKISTESGGRVTRVRASLGDYVAAGQILAEVENATQRAAVLQAEGALEAAKASNVNTDVSLDSAKKSAVTTLLSAYAAVESAVHDTIDDTFVNPESGARKYTVLTTQSQDKMVLENNRADLSVILKRQASQSTILTSEADLTTELAKTEAELRTLRSYLDTDIKVLNAAVTSPEMNQTTINGYLADATAARAAVTSSISAVVGAQSSLQVASNNSGDSGAVSASGAAIKQAQGSYNLALAALEKTIIRSPISGTLNNFTIKLGDFLTPAQEVAVVSNNGSLEAVAYVTEEDRLRIAVGQKVTIDDGLTGTITRIAPALDPVTRRIEVRIALPKSSTFVNGESVRVNLGAAARTTVSKDLSIPITALKLEANRALVYTVVDNKLVGKEITIGAVSGNSVRVLSGVDADTEIVKDVRGLKEGEEVVVNNE